VIDRSIEVISGDVSTYSIAIGSAMVGRDCGVRMREDVAKEFPVLAEDTSPMGLAAMTVIALDLGEALKKGEKTRFYAGIVDDIRRNQAKYMAETKKKLQGMRDKLGDFKFEAIDCMVGLKQAQAGDVVFFDPPFWETGYEKMFANMCRVLKPLEVPYTVIDAKKRDDMLVELNEKGCTVFTRPEFSVSVPGYREVFQWRYKPGRAFVVYSNDPASKVVQGEEVQIRENPKAKLACVGEHTVLTGQEKVAVTKADGATANHYRLAWTRKATMRDAGTPFFVTLDGMLVAIVCIMSGQAFGNEFAVLVADCVPPHSQYSRLSKGIVMMVLSREFLGRVNKEFSWEHSGFTTIAYTNAPSSMKYRGLFEFIERKDPPEDSTVKNALVYRTDKMRFATMQEAYGEWFKKFGSRKRDEAD